MNKDSTPYPHPVSPFLPWYPNGTVKAWDDIARDYIPLFKDSMHVAYTQTPAGLHGAYDIKIEKSGQSIYYATLHRGIYCYYYKAPSIGLLPPTVDYPLRIIANDVHTNPDGTAVGMFYPIPDYLHGKPVVWMPDISLIQTIAFGSGNVGEVHYHKILQ